MFNLLQPYCKNRSSKTCASGY